MLLITRLLTRGRVKEATTQLETVLQAKESLVSHILDDFKERMDLALLWLNEEYLKKEWKDYVVVDQDSYEIWFHKLLHGLREPRNEMGELALDPKDRAFSRFLIEAPEITDEAIGVIESYCNEEERMPLGISTLRDLVLYRPAVRDVCLNIMLFLCLHKDKTTRATSIVTVKKFYREHPTLGPKVEAFALETIKKLQGPPEIETQEETAVENDKEEGPEVDKMEPAKGEGEPVAAEDTAQRQEAKETEEPKQPTWKETDIIRHLELYFSLCSKHQEFLDEIFKLFPTFSEEVQRVVRVHIGGLIKALSSQPAKLLGLIKSFPEGTDALILRIIVIMATKEPIPAELIEAVKELYRTKDLDGRYVIPILMGLSKV
jgi:symplekin